MLPKLKPNPTKGDDDVSIRNNGPDSATEAAVGSDSDDFRAIDPHSGVKRGLKTRHLSMMALAGIIGPGLLIGSGGALSAGGPASLLFGFGVIGIIAFSIMQSLGELTTLYPTGGAFTALSDRFVDKAFGVAVGWNYYIVWFCVLANEYNVVSSIMVFWSDKVPIWGYFLLFWVSPVYRSWRKRSCSADVDDSSSSSDSNCWASKHSEKPSSGWL
jgi:amino acid transporter